MSAETAEPRRHARTPQPPQGLLLNLGGREIPAKLVDASEGGLGVTTFVPLAVGSLVELDGHLDNGELQILLQGKARVVHCRSGEDGVFRVGLSLEEVGYRQFHPPWVAASSARRARISRR